MPDTLFFLIGAAPLLAYAGLSDLRTMTIPNWISIALVAIFIVLGLIFLPLETVGWRLLAGFIVLAIGFVLNAIGLVGGGDVKVLAGFTPFIAGYDASAFLLLLSVAMIGTLVLHRIAMRIGFVRRLTPTWKSWEAGRYFPMGISIAVGGIAYLAIKAFGA